MLKKAFRINELEEPIISEIIAVDSDSQRRGSARKLVSDSRTLADKEKAPYAGAFSIAVRKYPDSEIRPSCFNSESILL